MSWMDEDGMMVIDRRKREGGVRGDERRSAEDTCKGMKIRTRR